MSDRIGAELEEKAIDLRGTVLAAIDPETREVAIIERIRARRFDRAGYFLCEMFGRGYDIRVLPRASAVASMRRHEGAVEDTP